MRALEPSRVGPSTTQERKPSWAPLAATAVARSRASLDATHAWRHPISHFQLTEVWMSEPFLSEIKIMSFNFPPKGWALCNGQLLPINQNQALFALLGTTYGGNGQTNFALPNLRGRVPIHEGNGHTLGEAAGSTAVTVNIQQLPTHFHPLMAVSTAGATPDPTNAFLSSFLNGY